nr:MAG TPA: hypothetical protein [Bacteriophage sp.]
MEAELFRLEIFFDTVENESFSVEFHSFPYAVSSLVRKILLYFGSKLILSFSLVHSEVYHPDISLVDPSNIDLFNYLKH